MANLQHVPGLAGYLAQQQGAQQQESVQLQQAGQVIGLQQALRQQAEADQLKKMLAASGGDVEKAMAAAIQSGNLAGAAKLAPIVEARRKGTQGQAIGAGGLRMPDGTIIPPATKPKEFAPPELQRLQEYLGGLPVGDPRRGPVEQRIKMLGERAGGVNVYSGSLVAGIDDKGNPVFVQPSGRPGVDPRVVPGVRPPPNAAAVKASKAEAEDQSTIDSVRQRVMSMSQKIQGNSGIVGPAGIVRRMGETAAGVISPDVPTPAIDYQNDMRLLVADVRKLVEKDPNLSNAERQNMYEMLGGGTFQTPGSAIRTLNNVLGFVENKKMTGPGRNAQLENAVKAAGWDFDPAKYDYRVVDGKVQRKAK